MDKVYYLKNIRKYRSVLPKVLGNTYPENSEVVVKLHFGEPGNKTALTPQEVAETVKVLNDLNIDPILFDTPVAYTSERSTVGGYKKAIRRRGFLKVARCKISNKGVPVKTKDMRVEVAKVLAKAKHVLVISHVKGHECCGFGGAIKNLGMGGITRESKVKEHNFAKPIWVKECQGCGTCAKLCPASAIKIVNGKAHVDLNECMGCSLCEMVCSYNCIKSRKALFDDLLAQAACAVMKKMPRKVLYINYLKNITEHCDCYDDAGKIVSKDIGVLFSTNPVAIDKASIDLINKINKKDVFKKLWNRDPLLHIEYASKYSTFSERYSLIDV
ncbi:DUF362 domain-containing protein [Candidatus Dojkabacteria bacterium]|nr:DUF362 domain-containing protein [Candidatus Dojkabacteria bacterium]